MNIEESMQQLETLIEAWQLNEADLNQTDIEAIKCLLEENKKLKKIFVELAKWLKENIRENTPNYRCLWLNEDESKKMEEINSPKTIMKPAHILYQEVLEKLDELRGKSDEN